MALLQWKINNWSGTKRIQRTRMDVNPSDGCAGDNKSKLEGLYDLLVDTKGNLRYCDTLHLQP